MIIRKSPKDIEKMHASGKVLASTHEYLKDFIKPGITTHELDQVAEEYIRQHGGVPTFKGYSGFPATLCTSPNNMIVHGIPGDYELKPGDLLSIDCGVTLGGWVSDSARSYMIGEDGIDESGTTQGHRLIQTAWDSLHVAIEKCDPAYRIGDVSWAVQSTVEDAGFAVVKKLVGHGVGRQMHEEPQIPNIGMAGTGLQLEPGWVFAIEPMITTGSDEIQDDPADGWSIYTADGSLAAHVEHTVAITENGPLVMTSPIEADIVS